MNEKKKSKKKLIICLSVLASVVLIVTITLTALFCPRKISSYINEKNKDLDRIEIKRNYMEEATYVVEDSLEQTFLDELFKIKVSPRMDAFKITTEYEIILYYKDTFYRIDDYGIYDGKKHKPFVCVDKQLTSIVTNYI